MSDTDPLTELARWARPGRRAELIAQAWQAGTTNVAELARVARVSRDTVYADLASRGIDHRTRPEARMHTPISLLGYTGEEGDHQIEVAEINRGASPEERHLGLLARTAARFHNHVFPYANAVRQARSAAAAAIDAADRAYDTLSSTPTDLWLAAHHQWQTAHAAARQAITTWDQALQDLSKFHWPLSGDPIDYYREQVDPDNQINLDPNPAEFDRHRLDEIHERRCDTAATTLRHLQPSAG